jgi:hypothetical protein
MKKHFEATHNGYKVSGLLSLGRYTNGQNLISLTCEDGCPYATATVSLDAELEGDEVLIKNYSENAGMEEALLAAGVIVGEPVREITSGFVSIPVYKLAPEYCG